VSTVVRHVADAILLAHKRRAALWGARS